MQKLNKSAHVDTTLTAQKAAANDEQYLLSVVQSAVAKHFAQLTSSPQSAVAKHFAQPTSTPPSNWKAIIEQAHNRMNKST